MALVALAGVAGVLLGCAGESDAPAGRNAAGDAAARPNIVVVMTDDQTVAGMRALPRTRRLIGDAGVSFDEFYVTDPLCCPSRATFLTGQYAHNHRVISNGGPNALPALRERDTLGVWLRRAGYRTALVGKYLNGYGADRPTRVPPGWSDWHALVDPSAQDYFDYELNRNGAIRAYGAAPGDYKTRVLGRLAAAAVRRGLAKPRPLFLYLGFNAPHAPSTPAPGDAGTFAGLPPSRSPAFDEADVSDKPSFVADRPPLDAAALARIADRNQRALESLLAVDREVARVIGELDAQGELDSTYVFFTSDNGYLAGEHRMEFGKLLAYEPSSRVPMLVRGPGIPAGASSAALAGNIDLAPTIVDLAGAEPTLEPDGRSLVPFATDPAHEDARPLLIESLVRDRSTYYGFPYEAIRAGDYLYVDYETGDEELYDLVRDPGQLESLHRDPSEAATKEALAAALSELAACAGAACQEQLAAPPVAP